MKSHLLSLICLLLLTQFAQAQAPTTGLVAYYPFTGNANDAAGTLNGTVNGATLTTDRLGNANQAYAFNGSSDFIEFSGPPTTVIDNWTLSVWVNLASLNQVGTFVSVGYDNGLSSGGIGDGYELGIGNGGSTSDQLQGVLGGVSFIPTGYSFTNTNVWYHLVMRRTSGVTQFFINGVLSSQSSTATPAIPTDFTIGSINNNRFFNGSLDEVRIYDRALSDAEVQKLFQAECATSVILTVSNPLNCTALNTTLTASSSPSFAAYTYNYRGPSGSLPGSTSAIVVSQPGLYSVTATATNGCSATTTTNVTSDTAPPTNVSLTSSTLTCAQTSVTLTASSTGGTSYTLSNGQSNTTGVFVVSTPGVYTVTASSPNGCTAATTATVQSNTAPPTNVSLTSGTLTCAQTSLTLTASSTGGTSYTLSNGQSNTTGVFVVNTPGTYTVAVSSSNSGCTATATATVQSNTITPIATLTSTTLCSGSSVTLTASGGNSYTFTGPGLNQSGVSNTAIVSNAGIFSVIVANTSGCTATASISLSMTPATNITNQPASTSAVCAGSPVSVSIAATGQNLTYQWYKGSSLIAGKTTALLGFPAVQTTDGGSYYAVVTGTCASLTSTAFTLTVNPRPTPPTLTGASRTVTISNMPLSLTAFVLATGSNTLSFSSVSGLLNPPTADISQAGQQSFSVTQTDGICTSLPTPFTITVQQSMTTSPGSQTVCRNSTVVLQAGLTGSRYEWYKNGQTTPFKLTEIASIHRGTTTASLTLVGVQTAATYYCKVFTADGSFQWAGPFTVSINFACTAARQAANEPVEIMLTLRMSPNPLVGGQLHAVVAGAAGQALSVQLLTLEGQLVHQQQWLQAEDEQLVEWDLNGRPVATYLLRAQTATQFKTIKVVKPD